MNSLRGRNIGRKKWVRDYRRFLVNLDAWRLAKARFLVSLHFPVELGLGVGAPDEPPDVPEVLEPAALEPAAKAATFGPGKV